MCHTKSSLTTINVIGLPEEFEANQSYQFRLILESEIPPSSTTSVGGFRMMVDRGVLYGEENLTQILDGWLTHTEHGSMVREWNFTWISPEINTTRTQFTIHANAVNGNGAPTGDSWQTNEIVLPGVAYTGSLEPKTIDGLSMNDSILLAAVTTLLVVLFFYSRKS